jgi:hypothetical protein
MNIKTKHLPALGTIGCGLMLLMHPLTAQTTASTPPSPATPMAAEDEIIELSPFVISADKGWAATDTLSANRTKQALKDVPIAIDAVTADFIEDLGLGTADEVFKFIAGVHSPDIMENDNQQDSLSFRGLRQGGNASRNYFRWYVPSDTYNVERIDFGKGSNSLIFGEIEPGGQASVFTKRALFRNFGRFLGTYDSDGAYRGQLDVNRKLTNTLAVRLNAVKREVRTYQDASKFGLEGVSGTLTWQPTKTTQIRIDTENGDFESARGYQGVTMREYSAIGRMFSDAGVYYTSDGQWVRQSTLPTVDRGGDLPTSATPANGYPALNRSRSSGGGQRSLIEGGYVDVVMRDALGNVTGVVNRYAGYPKHYNTRGAFDRQGRPFNTYTFTVEQRLGPVNVEMAYNHQNQHQVRTDNVFSRDIRIDVNGRPFVDATLDEKRFSTETDAYRLTGSYKFDKWDWTEQQFVVSAEYLEEQFENIRWQYYDVARAINTNTPVNITNDRARLRLYLDDPRFYSRTIFDQLKPGVLPYNNDFRFEKLRLFASGGGSTDGTYWRQASAFSASASGKYFNGRLLSLIGFRRDYNRLWEYFGTRKEGYFNEEAYPLSRKDALPGDYVQNMGMRGAVTTVSSGLTFAVNRDINIYASYGESFRFQDAVTFDNIRFGPVTGESMEIGIKADFWDKKASLTLGAFEIDRLNAVQSWNSAFGSFSRDELIDLMNPTGVLPGNPAYREPVDLVGSAARNYNSTESSRGADATLFIKPMDGLQLRFTAAYADVEVTPDLKNFRRYYDEAVARGDESSGVLREAKEILDSLDIPSKPVGSRAAKWSASWIVDYKFSRDTWKPLRNLGVGINGSWRDDYLFAILDGRELVGGGQHVISAYVSRDFRIFGQRTTLRLRARNIEDLENGDIRKTGFTTMQGTGERVYTYAYVNPITYELSMTVNF